MVARTLGFSNRILAIPALVTFVVVCYFAQGYRMDKETAVIQHNLGIPKEEHVFGSKGLDRMGRLTRRDTMTSCGNTNAAYAVCMANALLHTNCLPVCKPNSLLTAVLCSALQLTLTTDYAIATATCAAVLNLQCLLHTDANGLFDFAGFNACCHPPSGPSACECPTQVFADEITCAVLGARPQRPQCAGTYTGPTTISC